jgi:hypothetical protein
MGLRGRRVKAIARATESQEPTVSSTVASATLPPAAAVDYSASDSVAPRPRSRRSALLCPPARALSNGQVRRSRAPNYKTCAVRVRMTMCLPAPLLQTTKFVARGQGEAIFQKHEDLILQTHRPTTVLPCARGHRSNELSANFKKGQHPTLQSHHTRTV